MAIVEPWQKCTSLSKVWESMIRTINISNQQQPTTKNQQPTTNNSKKFKSFHALTLSPWRSKAEKVCVFCQGEKNRDES